MGENNEERIVMLTIKEAAALVEGLTEYRVRQMCIRSGAAHHGWQEISHKQGIIPKISARRDCVKK